MATGTTTNAATATNAPANGSGFLSMATAQKAGIVLAVAIILIFFLLGLLWLINRRKRSLKLRQKRDSAEVELTSEQDTFSYASEKDLEYQQVPLRSPRGG